MPALPASVASGCLLTTAFPFCVLPTDTCHTKSVITKPQNVCVMRDIMCSGYVAGGNTAFFGESEANKGSGVYTPGGVKDAIENRLAFQDDASGEYESMLAFCAPYNDGAKRDQVISITDRLLSWEVTKAGGSKEYFPGEKKNFDAASAACSLNTIHYGEDVRASENMEFISAGAPRARQTQGVVYTFWAMPHKRQRRIFPPEFQARQHSPQHYTSHRH